MTISRALKSFIPFIILSVIGFFLWQALGEDLRKIPSPLINESTPEFSPPNLLNPKLQLNKKLFLGHVTLLNVWATWCSVCMSEYPIFMDIARSHLVSVVGLDYKDERTDALNWLHEHGNPFNEIGYDESGNTGIDWGVYGIPETFIIDKQGVVRYKYVGKISRVVWEKTFLPKILALQ